MTEYWNLDMLLMALDNAPGPNDWRWKVGRTVSTTGDALGGWSQTWGYQIPPGDESQGRDFAAGDINGDGRIDLLFAAVINPSGANYFAYRIRWGI